MSGTGRRLRRRDFIKSAGLGLAASSITATADRAVAAVPDATSAPRPEIKLGVASYSLRKLSLEAALNAVQRLGIRRATLKSFHLPLDAPETQIRETMAAARSRDIEVYAGGTIYMNNEAEVEQAFRYASTAGFEMIVCAPAVPLLPLVERRTRETGVLAAIHNHGPDNPLYPSPLDAFAQIKDLDPRLGLCVDIGHTQRLGQDPAEVFSQVFDRVFDVHIKDVSASTKAGQTVEIGRGVIDIPRFLKAVVARGYRHTLSFEHEKDADDPVPGLAESIGFVRGMLRLLSA